jgi:two-component sensor histidine kinase
MPENGTYSARALGWIAAVLFVISSGLFGIYALQQRWFVEREAVSAAQNLALLLAEHTQRFLDASHLVTSMAMTQAAGRPWSEVRASHEAHEFLRRLPENFHFVEAVGLADQNGDLVLTSDRFPAPPDNMAASEHFRIQEQTDAGPFLSRLLTSDTTGRPSIYMSRRINDERGQFRGVATALIDPQSFYSFYATLRPELPIVVDVFRSDLAIVFRYPPEPEAYGQKWGGRDNLGGQLQGVLLEVEDDGRRRTEAFAKVGDFPVFVSVALNNSDIRRAWRREILPGAVLSGSAFLLIALLLTVALILARRHEAAGIALRVLAENLEDRVRARTRDLEQTSEELARHVEDKEAQTREMNHRVKNSLQLVGALLRLQGKAAEDTAVEEQLEEASNRVATVARVHDKLYRSADLKHIPGDEYLRALCGDLQRTLAGVDTDIRFTLSLDPIKLNADKAILIGLVVSELVSSAAKNAFLPGQKGMVTVVMQRIEGGLRLVVGDDGERAPDSANIARNFSGTVVTSLIDQLEGKAEYHSGPDGNSVVIVLPLREA